MRPGEVASRVSVVMPHYDSEPYLEAAVESVFEQSYSDLEVVIVDSSDSAVARRYAERRDDVVYEFQAPTGVSAARNRGIELATGEFVAFLDADDYWLPDSLGTRVELLADADVVYSDMYIERDGDREYYEAGPFADHVEFFRSKREIPSRTVVARRSVFDDWRFNEELRAREDPNLWTKLMTEYRFAYLPEATGVKRIRQGSLTSDAVLHTRAKLESYEELVELFPELGRYEEVRLRRLEEHALTTMKAGRRREARVSATAVLEGGRIRPIPVAVLACSLLPRGDAVYRFLSRVSNGGSPGRASA